MTRFFAVIERDIRKFYRNPVVIAVSLLMPMLYLLILGNSFQGELKNLSLAVVDMDSGTGSTRVKELLQALEAGPRTVSVINVTDQAEAMEGLKKGLYKGVLVIPPDFSKDLVRGRGAEVGLFLDNADTISASSLRSAVASALKGFGSDFVPVREKTRGPVLREIELYKKVDYDQTLIPGVVIMAIFLGAMTTGVFNIVMDRFLGVEESYFMTPLTRHDIVMGLIVSGLIITTVLAMVVLVVSTLMLGIYLWKLLTLRGLLLILAVIVLSTLGLQGLMFIIMGRANHPRIVGVLGGFLNVILFFPSGAIYPVESFPRWLKAFAVVNPETYSVHAMRSLLFKGSGLAAVQYDLAYLLFFAFLSIASAIALFKRGL